MKYTILYLPGGYYLGDSCQGSRFRRVWTTRSACINYINRCSKFGFQNITSNWIEGPISIECFEIIEIKKGD